MNEEGKTMKEEGQVTNDGGGGGMPPKTFEELKAIAIEFAEPNGRGHRGRVNARPGLLAATDGRVLIHVESPVIEEIPDSASSFLDFTPEPTMRVAGREWIETELRPAVDAADKQDLVKSDMRRREFMAQAERDRRRCPCCDAEVIDDGDDLVEYEGYLEENTPDSRCATSSFGLRPRGVNDRRYFSTFYLARMLWAAAVLGGAEALRLGANQLVLKGAGWWIVCLGFRHDGETVGGTIDLPEVPETGGAAAGQEGGAE